MSVCVLHACKENHCDKAMIDQGGYPCGGLGRLIWALKAIRSTISHPPP